MQKNLCGINLHLIIRLLKGYAVLGGPMSEQIRLQIINIYRNDIIEECIESMRGVNNSQCQYFTDRSFYASWAPVAH